MTIHLKLIWDALNPWITTCHRGHESKTAHAQCPWILGTSFLVFATKIVTHICFDLKHFPRVKEYKTNTNCWYLRKSISGKFFIFRKCYFSKRKMYSGVWLCTEFVLRKWDSGVCFRKSFYGNEIYGKSFPAFVSGKYFLKNKYFSENKYFPEMLFSGKKNIFRLCLVA